MDDGWNWYWGAGSEPERYHLVGSREEALEAVAEDAAVNGCDRMTICEGKPWPLKDDIFDAGHVLDSFHEYNSDACDEDGELDMNPTPEQKRELEVVLNTAFGEWRAKHKLGRAWCLDTRNEEILEFEVGEKEEAPSSLK